MKIHIINFAKSLDKGMFLCYNEHSEFEYFFFFLWEGGIIKGGTFLSFSLKSKTEAKQKQTGSKRQAKQKQTGSKRGANRKQTGSKQEAKAKHNVRMCVNCGKLCDLA